MTLLTKYKEELLCSAQSKHGDEAPPTPRHYVMDSCCETRFPDFTFLMHMDTKRRLLQTRKHRVKEPLHFVLGMLSAINTRACPL